MVKKHKDLKVLICRVSTVFLPACFEQMVLNSWLVVGIAKHRVMSGESLVGTEIAGGGVSGNYA